MNKKEKGFIGAIGDDLPSLIPIFVGLMIFFAVFLSTYNNYKTTTNLYSLQQDAISISITLKSEPLIPDYNLFMKTCNKVNSTKNWNAFLVDLPLNINDQKVLSKDTFEDEIVKDDETENKYICKEMTEDELFTNDPTVKKIVYMYPITLIRNTFATPAKLYVIVWNN